MSKPTHTVEELQKLIPVSDLQQVRDISEVLRNEINRYRPTDYTNMLVLITRRLIELSNAIRVH